MNDTYFVIHFTEDGEAHISAHTRAKLLALFAGKAWGDEQVFATLDECRPGYSHGLLIIKGEVVAPFAKEKVVEFDIK